MMTVLRALRRRPSPRISRERALQIAEEVCLARGYGWILPVRLNERLDSYELRTNLDKIGGNALVVIDNQTGEVRHCSITTR